MGFYHNSSKDVVSLSPCRFPFPSRRMFLQKEKKTFLHHPHNIKHFLCKFYGYAEEKQTREKGRGRGSSEGFINELLTFLEIISIFCFWSLATRFLHVLNNFIRGCDLMKLGFYRFFFEFSSCFFITFNNFSILNTSFPCFTAFCILLYIQKIFQFFECFFSSNINFLMVLDVLSFFGLFYMKKSWNFSFFTLNTYFSICPQPFPCFSPLTSKAQKSVLRNDGTDPS